MDPKLQSNFIPKGPSSHSIGTGVYNPRKESLGPSLLGLLGVLIFVFTLLAAGGVFGYKIYLNSHLASMKADLDHARAAINPDQIKELTSLNTRIVATKQILDNHTILSPLFTFIEANIVSNVSLTEFHYSDGGNGGITLSLKGLARGYDDVALQSNIFNSSKYLSSPIFSDLKLNDKGQVEFTFSATVDPSLVSFSKWVSSGGAATTPLVAPQVPAPATTTQASTTSTKKP